MQSCIDCIPCFLRQAVQIARLSGVEPNTEERIIKGVLRLLENAELTQSPPAVAQKIHRLIIKATGNPDPYKQFKVRHNQLAWQFYRQLRSKVERSEQPFATAVRSAIAGNVIDVGAKSELPDASIERSIEQALNCPIDEQVVGALRQAANEARSILYLADNAGEVVFDRFLVDQLPWGKTTFVVRGAPVLNDATMEDARAARMGEMVAVIDNGSDAPGTILEDCSQRFQEAFASADLVIAKGQGNYETLNNINKNIFFILKAKCSMVARQIACEIGSAVLLRNKSVF